MHCNALAANKVMQQQTGSFRRCREGVIGVHRQRGRSVIYVRRSACGLCLVTRKTCLVPRSDEFEGQGQRSKIKIITDKNGILSALSAACVRFVIGKTSLAST